MQHLERHGPVVSHVLSEIHGGHAPAAELALDSVAIGQCGLQPCPRVHLRDPVSDEGSVRCLGFAERYPGRATQASAAQRRRTRDPGTPPGREVTSIPGCPSASPRMIWYS